MKCRPQLEEFELARQQKCNRCGENIGFVKSKRTGKWYPININVIAGTQVMAGYRTDFHKCSS